jgi:hypothetical protein
MKLDENIKKQIEEIFHKTDDNIHTVSIGYKYKNNIKTNEISLVFGVLEKKPLNDIPVDSILPSEIKLGDTIITTDVIQQDPIKTLACYTEGDYEINRLRTLALPLSAFKGGMEIRQYPTNYYNNFVPGEGTYSYFSTGTLGFFAKDNIDGKVVGVTNNHVVCYRKIFVNERHTNPKEIGNPYNTIEANYYWSDSNLYNPGALSQTQSYLIQSAMYIKRYQPVSLINTNYADVALVIIPPSYIDNNSYQMWQPSTNNTYPTSLPFASTFELDNLFITQPKIYSTGKTTGPKGYNNTPSCNLVITGVGASGTISDPEGNGDWADIFTFEYQDGSNNPIAGGDSGSCVIAEIGGIQKIIGLVFAGNTKTAYACRIDRIANLMNISAFTIPTNTSYPTSTSITTSNISKYGDKASIVINGKTYYQSGLTYSTSYSSIN